MITAHGFRHTLRGRYSRLLLACSQSLLLATVAVAQHDLSSWQEVISHRPPAEVQIETSKYSQTRLRLGGGGNVHWFVQRIERDGEGLLSLDYYPVYVRTTPVINGERVGPEELLQQIRINLNSFVSESVTTFSPYKTDPQKYGPALDNEKWASRDHNRILGTHMHIETRFLLHVPGAGVAVGSLPTPDDAAVVVSESNDSRWRFSTIYAAGHRYEGGLLTDGRLNGKLIGGSPDYHALSGVREFGWTPHPNGGYTFYTKGADRVTGTWRRWVNRINKTILPAKSPIVVEIDKAQDILWRSFQSGVVEYVNSNGGEAVESERTVLQVDWDTEGIRYHKPSNEWVETGTGTGGGGGG